MVLQLFFAACATKETTGASAVEQASITLDYEYRHLAIILIHLENFFVRRLWSQEVPLFNCSIHSWVELKAYK
jgi:hypothetical protein